MKDYVNDFFNAEETNLIRSCTDDIVIEMAKSFDLHGRSFNSCHEAYAVILEELDEFWDECRAAKSSDYTDAMYKECAQTAAMCLKFMVQAVVEDQDI